jgi:Na+/H+-dicarboxylate symporter/ABC-type amino acid transport substrate-binding protein
MTDQKNASPASLSLLHRVTIGLIAGAALGVFLGERARVFQSVAEGFVKLLQMAVLPYVTVSIIGSIGALRLEDMRTLGARAALVLVGLWALALMFAFLMPLTFPPTQSASFFSTTLIERPPPFDLVDLYIPANPFFALANNVVPAVVLFSIVVGVALIGVPRKQILIDVLRTASDVLAQAMRFVVQLTPYGVFAIAATAAGTLRLEQVSRLEIYLIGYGALAAVLALWVLPGLVGALTPISVREIFAATHGALLTATIAGDLFIVIPVLIAACKDLIARHTSGASHVTLPDVIVPISYNFPHSGKLLSLSFILFAGWFSDAEIRPEAYPKLALTGLLSLFGSVTTAMPFLLDAFRVPADTFQLFVASGVINSRVGTLVAAMHTVAIALIGTCAVAGALRWKLRAVAKYVAVTVMLTVAAVVGTRLVAAQIIVESSARLDPHGGMRLDERSDHEVVRHDAVPAAASPLPGARLLTVATTRVLRVGYLSDALPFAFFNARGELVGFDVALVHRLAIELGVGLEFVPIERETLDRPFGAAERLSEGYCDIILGGLAVTTQRAGLMQLSSPYLNETLGFVVPDHARHRFDSWDAIRASGPLTIAMPDVPYFVAALRTRLPQAQVRTAGTMAALFGRHAAVADAVAMPAERGSAWTLRYPQYAVVVPSPGLVKVPLAYAMPRGEPEFGAFVNTFIDLKRQDGTIDALYEYWILGRNATPRAARWSIIVDVLHWADPPRPAAGSER